MGVDHLLADRVGCDDVHVTVAGLRFCDAVLEIVCQRADLMRVGNQLVPALGQRNGVVDALKKQAAQFILQLLDLKGNGGLRITELVCGFRKASQLRNVYKCNEISQFHSVLLISKKSMIIIKTIRLTNA